MMVTRWGLSDELGTVAYGENQDEVFLGYQVARQQNISEETSTQDRRRDPAAGRSRLCRSDADPDRQRADLEVLRQGPARVRNADAATRSRTRSQASGRCASR